MKKLLPGLFLVVSVLLFSAERKTSVEQTFKDENSGKVYVQGEKNPYTGIVEAKYSNGKVKILASYKNGTLDGRALQYYENRKIKSEDTFMNETLNGISKGYYETGKLEYEISYKNDKKDGIEKRYSNAGILVVEFSYKNGRFIKTFLSKWKIRRRTNI